MTRNCLKCGKPFHLNRIDKIYCSQNCSKGARIIRKYGSEISAEQRRRKDGIYRNLQIGHVICQICGFIPVHLCQLDVDHIDGNHKNRHPSNIQILCANCHRLKTFINKDWEKKN